MCCLLHKCVGPSVWNHCTAVEPNSWFVYDSIPYIHMCKFVCLNCTPLPFMHFDIDSGNSELIKSGRWTAWLTVHVYTCLCGLTPALFVESVWIMKVPFNRFQAAITPIFVHMIATSTAAGVLVPLLGHLCISRASTGLEPYCRVSWLPHTCPRIFRTHPF